MKRHFLSTVCSLAMLLFIGQTLNAQQETTTNSADKVIIIQKTQNDDGTWTVKKKSIEKGQKADEFIKDADINIDTDVEVNSEIIIRTNGDGSDDKAETIMYIRKGDSKTEIKWDDTEGSNFKFDKLDKGQFALIADENGEEKAFLGIYPETAEKGGVLVTDVVQNSGAANAGLKSGDVIKAIDGKNLASQRDLSSTLASHKPGDVVSVSFDRDGQSMTTTATLTTGKKAERAYKYDFHFNNDFNYDYVVERDPCKVFIGVQIGSWGDGVKGVGVSGIITGWPAESAGLLAGDRIVSIDGITVNSNNELVAERDKHKPGEYFTIGYVRDGKLASVKAQFKTCPGQESAEPAQETVVEQPALPQIDNSLELEEMNAFPNPSYGDLNIHFKGEAVPTTVTITDINGKTVFSENLPNFDGVYDRLVDVSKGTPGTLLVSVRQGGKIITKPVVLLNRA